MFQSENPHLLRARLSRVLVVSVLLMSTSSTRAEVVPDSVNALIGTHCLDCHDASTQEGGLDLASLSRDISNEAVMAKWVRIHDRVAEGEMPPEDVGPLPDAQRNEFLNQLSRPLIAAHSAHKGTVLRRLNAREYENTLNDLFGTNLKLRDALPPDGRSHEFDNVGESLSMSMIQLQRYMDAMNGIYAAAIAKTVDHPEPTLIRASYADTRGAEKFLGKNWHQLDDGAVVFYQPWGYPTGMLREANTNQAGWYKIRVHGYAFQSSEPITFSIGATTFARGLERPTFGYFSMPPGKPTTIELTAWIEDRYMVEVTPYGIYDEHYEIKKNGIENYTGPGLAVKWVELEGPLIDEFPSRGHKLLFTGLNRREIPPRNPNDKQKPWYKPRFEIVSETPAADVGSALHRVAEAAFRRPVTQAEIQPYVDLFLAELDRDSEFEEAYLTAVTAIFCSPHFLYFNESTRQLDDYALAGRLSYFLTRTLPDAELLQLAEQEQLSKSPQVLAAQVDRLLEDPRSARFVEDFTDAWLNLRDIEFTTPDSNIFPEYDEFLLFSMLAETRSYFTEQIRQNLPVETIVKSDFAMLNNRLAEHYGVPGVDGPEIRQVALPAGHERGGSLSQASVLKVSANGTNTSPVVRGVWVLERIMGVHPPPPPPGVPGVEPDIRGASTLREILAKHRDQDNCRACHEMIDPPGFALESFDPVGRYREHFRSLGAGERVDRIVHGRKVRYRIGPPVDASGQWSGGTFDGYVQFRDQLANQREQLTQTFVKKLLVFATGREFGFSDREEIEQIVRSAMKQEQGMRELVHAVVQSRIFRTK